MAMTEARNQDGEEAPSNPDADIAPAPASHTSKTDTLPSVLKEKPGQNLTIFLGVIADNAARRTAMFKNPHLRLLMKLVGMERLTPSLDESPDSAWIIPATVTADHVRDSLDAINKAEFTPPTFEDGQSAEDQLKRKSAARKRVVYDDDDDVIAGLIDDDDDDDGILFPAGGPTVRKSTAEDAPRPKKRRRQRRAGSQEPEPLTEEQLDEKARARRQKELEKARRIKSSMYVHDSDDDSDAEWSKELLRQEELRREAKKAEYGDPDKSAANPAKMDWDLLMGDDSDDEEGGGQQKSTKKKMAATKKPARKRTATESDEEEEGSGSSAASTPRRSPKRRKPAKKKQQQQPAADSDEGIADDDDDDNMLDQSDAGAETNDTPLSSNPGQNGVSGGGSGKNLQVYEGVDDDDDDVVVAPTRVKQRARGGFIVDSSDDE
jgi:replication fork protection complex subunit Tof1/Swi1